MPARSLAHAANPRTARTRAIVAPMRCAIAAIAESDIDRGARAITAVINASLKLQRLRARAAALEVALTRMKAKTAASIP